MQTKIVPIQNRAYRTRTALLTAVERIVESLGPEAVTTTSVARESGVAVGTIYRYFPHREALLLAAYDATVSRIVQACAAGLEQMNVGLPMDEAARQLLALYLDTAVSIPSHAGLLKAMRTIRPVEADQSGNNDVTITGDLIAPFWSRYGGASVPEPAQLHFISVLLGTLVDLYLMASGPDERLRLRGEIEAHMLLALQRATGGD